MAKVHIVERISAQDATDIWYCPQDFTLFRAQTQQRMHQLQDNAEWKNALFDVYCAFCDNQLS